MRLRPAYSISRVVALFDVIWLPLKCLCGTLRYHKVVRGQYPRIPAHYGLDLAYNPSAPVFPRSRLSRRDCSLAAGEGVWEGFPSAQVHPRNRPSVEQLLQMPQMLRHSSGLKEDASAFIHGLG